MLRSRLNVSKKTKSSKKITRGVENQIGQLVLGPLILSIFLSTLSAVASRLGLFGQELVDQEVVCIGVFFGLGCSWNQQVAFMFHAV